MRFIKAAHSRQGLLQDGVFLPLRVTGLPHTLPHTLPLARLYLGGIIIVTIVALAVAFALGYNLESYWGLFHTPAR